jgi:hypothetical protein
VKVDRHHIPWALFTVAATAIMALLFGANFYPHLLPFPIALPDWFGPVPPLRRTYGGTPLGLIFGTLALLIFLFAAALGIRKKKRLWRIGNVQLWLRAHIWLSIITIPLVLFHCGFAAGGLHTTALLIVYALVMVSGFFGLALQQFMPRLMKELLPQEVVYEQIPHIRHRIYDAALELRRDLRAAARATPAAAAAAPSPAAASADASAGTAAAVAAPPAAAAEEDPSPQLLGDFLDEEALPYLRARRGDRRRLGDHKTATDLFRLLKLSVSEKWQPKVETLQQWCNDRREMDLQLRLHHWLHGWLLLHVPLSFALLVMTLWHAWISVQFLIVL